MSQDPDSDRHSRVFAALADARRRQILEYLAEGPLPVHALAVRAGITSSGVSQHLAVLREAGLVQSRNQGRESLYRRVDGGLRHAESWLGEYRDRQLSRLPEVSSTPYTAPLHVSAVQVPVVDPDESRDFYIDTLGFSLVTDNVVAGQRWIAVLPPAGACAIALQKAPRGGIWTGITMVCDDIHEHYKRWSAAGVTFHGPPVHQPWLGWLVIFADLDGNRMDLVELDREG